MPIVKKRVFHTKPGKPRIDYKTKQHIIELCVGRAMSRADAEKHVRENYEVIRQNRCSESRFLNFCLPKNNQGSNYLFDFKVVF